MRYAPIQKRSLSLAIYTDVSVYSQSMTFLHSLMAFVLGANNVPAAGDWDALVRVDMSATSTFLEVDQFSKVILTRESS